jgi:DNA polymerase-3 subunit epsilon
MIIEEFNRAGIDFDIAKRKLIDVQKIFFKMEKRDLTSAYKFYCNETLENAHSAMSDVKATYAVLKGQLDRYEDLKADAQFLHEFSNEVYKVDLAQRFVLNADKEPVFNFGKHKGRKIEDVLNQEPQYYDWMMKNDFPTETKKKLTEIRLKAFNRK